ncbi:MAG: 4-hydroxy-3-methylbut-2-enyl diphosphate reductase [Dehalococcoidia bacterium]|nr:MAG: 4-hydroxy-3-methylbut-2-enyl diphosphate reductase [Dehalococcoidia bacterium]
MRIEKAAEIGFCFGVKRAVNILEKVAREQGGVETLGAIVHNQQVVQKLAEIGVRVVDSVAEIKGKSVAISCHGVDPQLEEEIRERHINIINTTCPFVHRAQAAAKKLADAGFFVVVYGDADHPEVRGVLGWTGGRGVAAVDEKFIAGLEPLPRCLGVLSQTTQIPADFTEFAKKLIDAAFSKDSEIRIIDTICHDIRKRQHQALKLAKKADLMVVIGGYNSANSNRLAELCSKVTKTYLVETADEIQPPWLQGCRLIGVTAGASTGEQTIDEVLRRLEAIALKEG